jgi:DNA-binding XRE family transcriptional regulator
MRAMSTKRSQEPSAGPRFADAEALQQHLGQRLKELREEADLTQSTLAERIGIGLRQLQNLEAGRKANAIDVWFEAARVLGVELDELLRPGGAHVGATRAGEGRSAYRTTARKGRGQRLEPQIEALTTLARELDAKTVAALIHLARGYRSR